jgi:hypothetical protein
LRNRQPVKTAFQGVEPFHNDPNDSMTE